MQDKKDLIINQLASNFATKTAQLEGEKAILQIELQEAQFKIEELQKQLEGLREEDK